MADGVLHQFAERLDWRICASEKEAIGLLTLLVAGFMTLDKSLHFSRL